MSLTLETERLLLRRFTLADVSDIQRLAGDRRIADTTLRVPHPYEDGMAEAWIATHESAWESGEEQVLAVTGKDDGLFVGAISLKEISAGHQAEMGYWIGVPYWGRGYCTEAGRAMLDYAFSGLGLIRVHAHLLSRNAASARVLQKLGMRCEGRLRQHVQHNNRIEDVEMYGILADEWRELNGG
jgi:RimJ/RimL family protein N-acetyltransferase